LGASEILSLMGVVRVAWEVCTINREGDGIEIEFYHAKRSSAGFSVNFPAPWILHK
jgi:hypothetical protein